MLTDNGNQTKKHFFRRVREMGCTMSQEDFCKWCENETVRRKIPWFGRHVQIGDEFFHYVEQGSGPPLLLIHGFMGWSYSWRHNLKALSERYRTIAIDLRGFGLSEKNGQRNHSLNDQVEVIKSFINTLKINRVILCGHSMGGEIALRFSLKYPSQVQGLVLVSSSGYVVRQERIIEKLALKIPLISDVFVRMVVLNRGFASRSLRSGVRDPARVSESDVEAYLLPAESPGASRAFVSILRGADFGSTASQLHNVTHPALIIWGANDPWLSVQNGHRLNTDLVGSQLVIFPECGHLPPEECPEAFNHEVLLFLNKLQA